MEHNILVVHLIKNEHGKYFTGNWRKGEQWSADKDDAKEFPSPEVLLQEIKRDREDFKDDCGYDYFPTGNYSIEIRIKVTEIEF